MFNFRNVTAKLGTMRKADEFVICEGGTSDQVKITLQSDKRIARVNLETGKVIVSDGKGGHPGFHKLSPIAGAKEYDCPPELLDELKKLVADKPIAEGPITIMV